MQFPKPLFVTETETDPFFEEPFIDIEEDRTAPVPHRYVSGGFKGTKARFSFYFPPSEQYQGRFFHNTYPMALSSDIGPFPIEFEVAMGDLGFTEDSGAYYVQTNNGGEFRNPAVDPAIPAYRTNAAAAKFSREVARRVYDREHRPYGYLFGGSGGAYQTVGAAENSQGIWDGFVPFVPGCDHAIPSMMSARMHALRELRRRDRFPVIADAYEPGGSGDPFSELNEAEAAAFREISLLGHPPKGWYNHAAMDSGYFSNIAGMIPALDPTYVEHFWSRPGYLGGDPDALIHASRVQFDTEVTAVDLGNPVRIDLAALAAFDANNSHLVVTGGAAAGASLAIAHVREGHVELVSHLDPDTLGKIAPGDTVRIDNSWALALETYHRHQLPPSTSYYAWNQFRDASGKPLYPQRDVLIGPFGAVNASGAMATGRHDGKMLMLAVGLDVDAYCWQADWYRRLVKEANGDAYGENYALYFTENSHHENPMTPLQRTHVVSYGGALQQALRDLAAWVEEGVRPLEPAYRVADTQVVLPASASERKGIQPVIELTANGGQRAEVKVGEAVQLSAMIEMPPGAGKVVGAEWDFEDSGDFPDRAEIGAPAEKVTLSASHSYAAPGTHFAVLRVAGQRQGNADTPYARVLNLARVRVVVS
ncbi:MAG: hypothetical protein AB7F98_05100 [Novosphingobium sp.]